MASRHPRVQALRAVLRRAGRDLLAFALPQRCLRCGRALATARALCARCARTLPRLDVGVCAACLVAERPGFDCGRHAGRLVVAPWLYDDTVAAIVAAFKFGGRPELAVALAPALVRALPRAWRRPDVVCPVPLHPTRRRERGYDQAACLARALANQLGAPLVEDALERVRPTAAQTGLGAAARRRNLAGAFRVRRAGWLAHRRVLVVDDVLTTGATFATALAAAGAAGAETLGVAIAWAP